MRREYHTKRAAFCSLFPTKAININERNDILSYFHRCVVDRDGFYISFVLVHVNDDGEAIDSYELKEGESLIDAPAPGGMAKPRWTGAEWIETLPPPEYDSETHTAHYDGDAWVIEPKPEPLPAPATRDEVLESYEAITFLYEENLALREQNLATMEAIAEIFEMVL